MTDGRCVSQITTSLIGLSIRDEPVHEIHESPRVLWIFGFIWISWSGLSWIEIPLTGSIYMQTICNCSPCTHVPSRNARWIGAYLYYAYCVYHGACVFGHLESFLLHVVSGQNIQQKLLTIQINLNNYKINIKDKLYVCDLNN